MEQEKGKKWSQPSLFDGTLESLREDLITTPQEKLPKRVLPQLVRWSIYRSAHEAKRDWLDSTRGLEEGILQPPSLSFEEYLHSLRSYYLELIEMVLAGKAKDLHSAQEKMRETFSTFLQRMRKMC